MKSILISIQPKWCELIASGKKTVEVRKTKPKISTPFKVYIYMTKSNLVGDRKAYKDRMAGKVIGEFVCDTIITDRTFGHDPFFYAMSCMSIAEIAAYCTEKEMYGWHISDLKIYDNPKELSEFRLPNICHRGNDKHQCIGCWDCEIKRPPQSYCYVEEV